MFRNIRQKILFLLLILALLLSFFPGSAAAITPCAECGNGNAANVTASGTLGDVSAANSPTGVLIPGAPWSLCGICSTVTVGGGGAQRGTGNAVQSPFPAANRPQIARIVFTEAVTAGTSLYDLFGSLPNLEEIRDLPYLDTAHTQRFARMFNGTPSIASGINLHLDLTSFDTGNVVSMYNMFRDSGVVTVDTTGWDTSSVTGAGPRDSFNGMFWGANQLTTIIGAEDWDTSSAQRFTRMFEHASSLTGLDPSAWDTSSVVSMYGMFQGTALTGNLDLSGWDVSNVGRMDRMFWDTSSLSSINMTGWNAPNLTQTQNMFMGLQNVTTLDLSGFHTSDVTDRTNMFNNIMAGPTPLRVLKLGPGWEWTATQNPALGNPPNNLDYLGLWQRVDGGTIAAPRGPTATAAELFDNSLFPDEIAGIWVWAPRVSPWIVFFEGVNGAVTSAYTLVDADTPPNAIGPAPPITLTPNANYVFSHWTSTQHAGNFTTDEIRELPISADTTFTAVFTRIMHGVTFNLNGGNVGGSTATITHTLPQGLPVGAANVPAPVRANHNFLGWRYLGQAAGTANLTSAQAAAWIVTGERTFVAQWHPQQQPPPPPPPPPPPVLERQAYLIGTPDGLIRPGGNITRAEVATIFFRLITDDMRADYWTQENPFPDVVLEEWFHNAVSTTANAGIFIGMPDGSFAPDRTITRAELATAVVRFMDVMVDLLSSENSFDDIDGHWAAGYINAAAVSGWVQGPNGLGGSFYPDRPITRAETTAIMNRIFGRLQESPEDLLPDMLTWPDNRNETSWYYLYIQSASNSYTFEWKPGGRFERWITIIEPRDWTVLERPDSRPEDILLPR